MVAQECAALVTGTVTYHGHGAHWQWFVGFEAALAASQVPAASEHSFSRAGRRPSEFTRLGCWQAYRGFTSALSDVFVDAAAMVAATNRANAPVPLTV